MKYRKKINILFVSIIASCVLSSVSAQKKIINMPPDAIPAEGGIVKARDKITLLPGFNFNAPPNTSLRIDKDMICTAEYLTTAPAPSNRDIKDNPVVGAISGNFNVTPTGAATYTIPIEIPPGTNGMQPSVALTYNSQGGNGPLGMGWQLAGMSAITRTGSNIYYDGEVGGIKYYGRDNFTLNGMRLMHVSGYLSGDEEIIFKTETNDFSKIIGHKDTDYTRFHGFTVYTKDGKKLYFGKYDGTSDAFIDKPGNEGDIALAFMIKKIEDANGNYILFEYKQDGFGFRIKKIKYTGNNDGIAPYNEIQFFYEERKDIGDKYAKGSYVRDRLLLNKIKTYCENKLFREYQLKYIYDETNFDVYSRLVEVTKHNNTGEQVNSTIVEWGENLGYGGYIRETSGISISNLDFSRAISGDINNDGLADLIVMVDLDADEDYPTFDKWKVYLNNNKNDNSFTFIYDMNFYEDRLNNNIFIADVDGDGMNEVIEKNISIDRTTHNKFSANFEYNVFEFNEDQTTLSNQGVMATFTESQIYCNNRFCYTPSEVEDLSFADLFADFNGDGKVEMFAKWEEYDDSYSYKAKFFHYNEQDKNKEITLNEYDCSFHTGDFNGDGKADILAIDETSGGGTTYIYDFDGNVIYENSEWPTKWHFVRTGNFNGDEYTDIITYSNGFGWGINLNKGNGYFRWPTYSLTSRLSSKNPDTEDHFNVIIGDFNGDGLDDIYENYFDILESVNDYYICQSKFHFNIFNSTVKNDDEFYFKSIYGQPYYFDISNNNKKDHLSFAYNSNLKLSLSDYNGDGKNDIVHIPVGAANVDNVQIQYPFPDEQKNLVQKITNGMDQSIEISYKTLTPEAGFYETTDDAHEDIASLAGPLFVVDDVTSPNGVGGTNTVYYSYKGGKIHLKGKGFLGFNEITVNHSASNETITQEYEILKPEDQYFHTAIKKTKTLVSDELISEQTFTNQIRTYTDSKRYFPYVSVSVKNNILQNTTHTITNSYDDYGNIYSSEKDFGDGIKSYTQNLSFTDKGSYIPYLPTSVRKIYEHPDHNSSFHTITDFSYDDNGNLASKTENAHTTDKSVTTYFENYDKFGNFKRKRIAPYNMPAKTTTYEFDYNGRFVYKQTNALGSTEYTYNHATGNTLTKTGITGLKTTYQYDNWGRRTKTILPDGQEINHSTRWYTGTNVLNAVYFDLVEQDGAPYQKTYYDILGRTVRDETVGYGNRVNYTHTTYNNKGQVQEETSSLSGGEAVQSTTYTYKSDGRPETTTLPGGKTITNSYNSISTGYNVTKTIETGGETRQYTKEYDKAGNLVKATDPGGEILYKYHANGQVKKITLANSEITMEYDNAGNQIALNDPDAGRMKYDYNALGDLTYQKDNKGNEFYLFYDNLWRLDKKTTDQAGTDIVADYAYVPSGNGIGKVQQVNGKFLDITRQYEYDQYHRTKKTIETIEGQTFTSEYHYDEHGNIHQTDYDNNLTVTRNYNNLGFLNTVKANGKFVWARENLSAREDKYYLGNNILTTNTYDNYGFPDEFEASYTSPIQKYDYAFNIQTGNLRSRQEQNGIKESFGYDNLDRLTDIGHDNTEVLSMQYNLQDKHNMNSKDDMGDVFNYTQQGNAGVHAVTSIEGLAPDAENLPEHDITWTAFNKVDQIREPDNNKHMYFTYGPEQQRKKVQYVHNHWVYDRYYSGNCEKTITYGNERTVYYISGGSGPAAAWVKEGSDENLYYIHTDHLGSIRAITDQNRNIVARYSFDAWGNRRNPDTWQLTDNPDLSFTSRGFTGHEHIDEFGLINMNGRVYDPTIGQFLSPDNYVQLPDASLGFNRYSYALNNPLIYTDPSGELFGLAIAAFLLFTDVGYNVQKYMSPVAVNFDVNPGNDRQFIRVNTSVGVPQAILLSYRVHAGASYYFEDYDGSYKGWETRWGGEYAVNLGKTQIMYSSTKYNRRGTKFDQTRDVYKIGNPFRYLEVENDCDLRPFNLPFLPEKDMSDKHLTHQMKYNVFGSEVGLNLFTGEPDPNVTYFEGGKEYYGEGGITNPNEYRAGILYMKFGGVKLGINDELIRDKTQNPFHDKIGTPRFEVLEKKTRFYWEIGN